jgi:nucleotide-binding universal stress UspA family protein
MGRYRKILVAVDGSAQSMHALRESLKLAVFEKCWITVVSVALDYNGDLSNTAAIGDLRRALNEPCEQALAAAMEMARGERALIKTVCEQGDPYERIVDLSEAENADLIVMGRSGRGAIEKTLIGSVTARVIGYSQKDVLVVPSNAEVGWKSILLATDGSKYSRAAAARAIDFAQSYNGALTALSVVDVPDEFYAEATDVADAMIMKAKKYAGDVKSEAEAKGVKSEALVREGDSAKAIISVAKDVSADVIVMSSHGRTGLRRLLMGSVTARVIGLAACPVLVVKS